MTDNRIQELEAALLDARAELAAAQQREAGLVERAEKAEAERDKWFEGAGAHHVASMQQAQRADIAEAELAAAKQREAKLSRIADDIDEQVKVTRAYAADSGMDKHQIELMVICTSHFIDKAREIRAALAKGQARDDGAKE